MNTSRLMTTCAIILLSTQTVFAAEAPKPAPAPAAAPAAAAPEAAVPAKMPRKEHFMKADANKDGMVSKQEFMASAEDRFKKLDTNADGNISKDEMRASHEKGRKRGGRGHPPAPGAKKQ